MIIGADAACWTSDRGYGRFTRELLRAMVDLAPSDTFVLFADRETAATIELKGPNVRVVPVELGAPPARAASAAGRRSLADMLKLTRAVAAAKLDVFFSPCVYTYFPLPPRLAAVVCIHDAIVERYPALTVPTARARILWRLKVGLALRQARLILTVSEYAAGELAEFLQVLPSRIRIATEAPSDAFRPSGRPQDIEGAAARAGLPPGASWFLYVGGFNPHKNVDVLVRAHGMLVADRLPDPPHLLLVGPVETDVFHADPGRVHEVIAEAGTQELVKWLGFVPDEELRHLHSGALALVLPSQCEGFGLPAVEAAACGTPTIATTESPLPDLLAGGGVFVKPGDAGALKAALTRMLCEEDRREMGRVALERARELSWERGARLALQALYEAAA